MSMKLKKQWKQAARSFLCVGIGVLVYLTAEMVDDESVNVENGILRRNDCGQGELVYEFYVDGISEDLIELHVPELQLSEDQFHALVPEMAEVLMERMKGENQSLEEVRTELNLVKELPEYGVEISWNLSAFELAEMEGLVYLEAELSCANAMEVLEIPVTILPLQSSLEERFQTMLEDLVLQNSDQVEIKLPMEFEGQKLQYRGSGSSQNAVLVFLGVIAAVCLYLKEKDDEMTARKKREECLLAEYPDFVYRFLILTGAGYSAKAAWSMMVSEYGKSEKLDSNPLYEEMKITLHQMETGTPETQAYTAFGRRCGNRNYIKFASLLESNVSTGGKNLRKLLEQEMGEAFKLRTDLAKRKGEEATTKLLLPTFAMLGVVMVMVMAPAFLSM